MDNNNPAEMSNEDLEKDMEMKNEETTGNQENVSKTTAAEGTLKTPDEDESSKINLTGDEKHNGNMPDPEAVSQWENNDTGDKMSG